MTTAQTTVAIPQHTGMHGGGIALSSGLGVGRRFAGDLLRSGPK